MRIHEEFARATNTALHTQKQERLRRLRWFGDGGILKTPLNGFIRNIKKQTRLPYNRQAGLLLNYMVAGGWI